MRILLLLFLMLALSGLHAPASADTACTETMQKEILSADLTFKNWDELHQFYSKYFSCGEDGAIGEGYSDAVVKLFANHWEWLSTFSAIAKPDPDFKNFVLKHIDATTDGDDLDKVINLSNKKCPASERALCKGIYYKATDARQEIKRDTGY